MASRFAPQERGGYILSADDKAKLQGTLWIDGHLNPKVRDVTVCNGM